ncbi:MAG: tyrosine-type recombinase/integrase [Hungatella sp.]|jgi:integrase|nr:tyrosine-type recombinase/integrase [Hungatella sp.]
MNTLQSLEQRLTDFRSWLESNNRAENTILSYSCAVRQFYGLYDSLNADNLQLYKCFLLEHYNPRTVNLRIRALNCYMEYCHSSVTPIAMLRMQQKTYVENVITQADYEYLKRCLIRDGNHLYYYLIRFMAATGVRVSELVKLETRDVETGWLDICSKGNKIRRIYIPKSLREDTLRWLAREGQRPGPLFLNRLGQPVTPAAIRGQLRKFSGLYGLDPAVLHPHSFRHRFAKNFIEACGDISFLSDLLGHQSIETTRIYLHRSRAEQQVIINQVVNW